MNENSGKQGKSAQFELAGDDVRPELDEFSMLRIPFVIGLLRLVSEEAGTIFLACVTGASVTLLDLTILASFFPILSGLSHQSMEAIPMSEDLMVIFQGMDTSERLVFVATAMIVLSALRGAMQYFKSLLTAKVEYSVETRQKHEIFHKFLWLSHLSHGRYKIPTFLSILNQSSKNIAVLVRSIAEISIGFISFCIIFALMLATNWQLALIAVSLLGVVGAFINLVVMKKLQAIRADQDDSLLTANHIAVQFFHGAQVVRAYNLRELILRSYLKKIQEYVATGIDARHRGAIVASIFVTVGGIFVGMIVLMDVLLFGQADLVRALVFLFVTTRITGPIQHMVSNLGAFYEARISGQRALAALSKEDLVQERISGVAIPEGPVTEIKLYNVKFNFPGSHTPSVDIDKMVFRRGRTYAVVGKSGAGKSTLLGLILGALEPTAGEVEVDGTPLRDISLSSWRSKLAFVTQTPFLFNASVYENIAASRPSVAAESVYEAAKAAQAHEFIQRLPSSYSTVVGNRGYDLSGGEAQRLTVARALVAKPDVLLLDEATSALDATTEKAVTDVLETLRSSAITIIVAHRLSTITSADQVFLMDEGKIVASGTHEELKSSVPKYMEAVRNQAV